VIPLRVLISPGHYLVLVKNAQALARQMAATERLAKLDTPFRIIEVHPQCATSSPRRSDVPEMMVAATQGNELVGAPQRSGSPTPSTSYDKTGTWTGGILGPEILRRAV